MANFEDGDSDTIGAMTEAIALAGYTRKQSVINKAKNMTSILEKDITTLRKGFALYCNLLGLKQNTYSALTLLLDSKILLVAMMKYMAELDEDRVQDRLTWDEITTLVVKASSKN